MATDIEKQLHDLVNSKGKYDDGGEYIPGDDVPEIPTRQLTPLVVNEITSEFRSILQDGEEKRAYELFAKVVEADESHIDAKRYLHLRKKKSEVDPKENAEEKTGFFSRLFGKK